MPNFKNCVFQWFILFIYAKYIQALAEMATSPSTYCSQLKEVTEYINNLCYAAGDTSSDLTYYTRRGAVLGIYNRKALFDADFIDVSYSK